MGAELTQTTTIVGQRSAGSRVARRWSETQSLHYASVLAAQIAADKGGASLAGKKGVGPREVASVQRQHETGPSLSALARGRRKYSKEDSAGDEEQGVKGDDDDTDDDDIESVSSGETAVEVSLGRNPKVSMMLPRKKREPDFEANSTEFIRKYGRDLVDVSGRGLLGFTIWDYGGQKVFYSLHNLFLSSQGIYLVVFDMRTLLEDEEAQSSLFFWLNSVKLHAPEAPMFLVGTFLDHVEYNRVIDINSHLQEFSNRFPRIVKLNGGLFFPLNNREGQGAKDLQNEVEATALKQEYVQQLVLVRWTKVWKLAIT